MKAISIQQPWAWFIIKGIKPVENRTWPSKYRGPLLIHAGKKFDQNGWFYLCNTPEFRDVVNTFLKDFQPASLNVPSGMIIGQVNMVDCVTEHPSKFFFGPFGHVYANPVEFAQPVPYRGQLGIFEVTI
jgi:hypothetical protein